MNELQIFNSPEFGRIRTVVKDGEPWFVGRDVAEALGYKNTKDALIGHVDEEDKRILQRSEIATLENAFANGEISNRGMSIINESGLYSLVLCSKLESARKFKRWITHEVIPAVRKHGAYLSPEKVEEVLLNPDTLIKLATQLKEERTARLEAEAKVEAAKPKVLFAESVEGSKTSILVGELAKLLKQNGVETGQQRLFAWMRQEGFLGTTGAYYNMPTQKSMEMRLFEIKERTVVNADGTTRITRTPMVSGKGQIYFVNRIRGGVGNEI